MRTELDPNFFPNGEVPQPDSQTKRIPAGIKYGLTDPEPRCVLCPQKSVVCVWEEITADKIGFYCREHAAELEDDELNYVEPVGEETETYHDLFRRSVYGQKAPYLPKELRDYLEAKAAVIAFNPNRTLMEINLADPDWRSKVAWDA